MQETEPSVDELMAAAFGSGTATADPEVDALMAAAFPPQEERGVLGYLGELGKSVASGFVGTVADISEGFGRTAEWMRDDVGIPDWTPKGTKSVFTSLGETIRDAQPNVAPDVADSLTGQVFSGLGGVVPFMGAGLAGRAVAGGAGALLGVGGAGYAAEASSAFNDALYRGASLDDAYTAMLWSGTLGGGSEAIPIAGWASRIGRMMARADRAAGGIGRRALLEGTENALQGALQGGLHEAFVQQAASQDDIAAIWEAIKDPMLPDGLVGILVSTAVSATERLAPEDTKEPEGPQAREVALNRPAHGQPEVVEVDETAAANFDRFAADVGLRGDEWDPVAASDEEQEIAGRTGVRVGLIRRRDGKRIEKAEARHFPGELIEPEVKAKGGKPGRPARFAPGMIVMDEAMPEQERRLEVLYHELFHEGAARDPEIWERFAASFDPEDLARLEAERAKLQPGLSPEVLREEAVSMGVERVAPLLRAFHNNPKLAAQVAKKDRGLFLTILDAIKEIAAKLGINLGETSARRAMRILGDPKSDELALAMAARDVLDALVVDPDKRPAPVSRYTKPVAGLLPQRAEASEVADAAAAFQGTPQPRLMDAASRAQGTTLPAGTEPIATPAPADFVREQDEALTPEYPTETGERPEMLQPDVRQVYVSDKVRLKSGKGAGEIVQVSKATSHGRRQRISVRLDDGTRRIVPMLSDQIEIVEQKRGAQLKLTKREKEQREIAKRERAEKREPRFSIRQTNTPEFRRWFGDSKVVDEKGEPLVVYHGTAHAKNEFSPIGQKRGAFGYGHYFTDNAEAAGNFAQIRANERGGEAAVMPVYIKLEKPLVIGSDEYHEWFERHQFSPGGFDQAQIAAVAQKDGYDGLIAEWDNVKPYEVPKRQFVVFDDFAIKSATGNRGTFDPKNPDIRYSIPRRESLTRRAAKAYEEGTEDTPYALPTADQKTRAAMVAMGGNFTREVRNMDNVRAEVQAALKDKRYRADLEERLLDGEITTGFDTVAAADMATSMAREAARNGFKGAQGLRAHRAVLALFALRSEQGFALQSVKDAYRKQMTNQERILELLTTPTKRTQRRLRELRKQMREAKTREARFSFQREFDALSKEEQAITERALARLRRRGIDVGRENLDDPKSFARAALAVEVSRATKWDKLLEYRYASMLSLPVSHAANVTGTGTNILYQGAAKRLAQAMVNTLARQPDAPTIPEVGVWFEGVAGSLKRAGSVFFQTLDTEVGAFEERFRKAGVETQEGDTVEDGGERITGARIAGTKGRIIRLPLRFLRAADEALKTLAADGEIAALAFRKAGGDRTKMQRFMQNPEVLQGGYNAARHAAFQNRPKDGIANLIFQGRRWLDDRGPLGAPVGTMLLPFVNTPVEIMRAGLRAPAMPLLMIIEGLKGSYKGNKAKLTNDTGEMLLGVLVGAIILEMAGWEDEEGRPIITGSPGSTPEERARSARMAPGYSAQFGNGNYYSYGRYEPIATTVGSVIDIARSGDIFDVGRAVLEQMSDKTFLRTFGDIYRAITDPEGARFPKALKSVVITPMVPNILRGGARSDDDFRRDTGMAREEAWEKFTEDLPYDVLPVPAIAPPILYDTWGRAIKSNGRSYFGRFVSPTQTTLDDDPMPADIALMRWNDEAEKPVEISAPERKWEMRDGSYHILSREQYARYTKEAGEIAAQRVGRLRFDPMKPTEQDIERIKEAVSGARALVRNRMKREIAREK